MGKFAKKWTVCFWAAIAGILLAGCVSGIDRYEMDLTISSRPSRILNLKCYEGLNLSFQQGEKLMKSGFLDTSGEEYGYYVVEFKSGWDTGTFDGWVGLESALLFIPSLIGVPTDKETLNVGAQLSIYDSNGTLVKQYQETGQFTKTAGLYYGHNPTKRAAKEMRKLFAKIQEKADRDSDAINYQLLAAGPVIPEKDIVAVAEIRKNHRTPYVYDYFSNDSYSPRYTSVPEPAYEPQETQSSDWTAVIDSLNAANNEFANSLSSSGTAGMMYTIRNQSSHVVTLQDATGTVTSPPYGTASARFNSSASIYDVQYGPSDKVKVSQTGGTFTFTNR
jgi:hypothetical protein